MMNNKTILSLQNISFSFDKKPINERHYLFNNLSISFASGSFNVIMGENGSGKSTLLNIIAGIKKEEKGNIILNDKDISDSITQQRDLAYMFQNPVLYPHLTIYQNLHLALAYYGLSEEQKDEKIKIMLNKIKMLKYVNFKPRHLSDGQKQKICLAKALIREPSLLLLDEPFSNLDIESQTKLLSLLVTLKNDYKTTIIMVSHNFESISNLASRLIILKNGQIVFEGTPINAIKSNDAYVASII